MEVSQIVRSAVMAASLMFAGPAMANRMIVSGGGVWDDQTMPSAYTAAGTAFSFRFDIDENVFYSPTTDFSGFRYELGGGIVPGVPMDISFYPADAGGGLQLRFAGEELLVGIGMPMLNVTNSLMPGSQMPMKFVTRAGFAAGNMSVSESAVPEPAMWLMMIAGFGAIGVTVRRQRRWPALPA